MGVFAIYDSKAEAFLQPWFSPTKATAIRSFSQAANEETSDFNRFAEDYTLFEIGSWEPASGVLVMSEAKVPLGTALEFRNNDQVREFAPVRSE